MDRVVEGKTYKITVTNRANGQIKELIHSVDENDTVPGASANRFWENIRSYIIHRMHWKIGDIEYRIAEYSEEVKEVKKRKNKKRARYTMCSDLDLQRESSGTGSI